MRHGHGVSEGGTNGGSVTQCAQLASSGTRVPTNVHHEFTDANTCRASAIADTLITHIPTSTAAMRRPGTATLCKFHLQAPRTAADNAPRPLGYRRIPPPGARAMTWEHGVGCQVRQARQCPHPSVTHSATAALREPYGCETGQADALHTFRLPTSFTLPTSPAWPGVCVERP